MKIKAKQRLRAMPQIVPINRNEQFVYDLYDNYLSDEAFEELKPYNGRYWKAFTIDNIVVYCRNYNDGYKFICFDNNEPGYANKITFICELTQTTSRNNLYKRGYCQSLVIKDKDYLLPRFTLKFVINLFKYHYIDTFLASDLMLSQHGAKLWEQLLSYFVRNNYRCYYTLSAPNQSRYMILLREPEDAKLYRKYLVGTSTGYRTRSAMIVQKGAKASNICTSLSDIKWMDCSSALHLNIFNKPVIDLTDEEFELYGISEVDKFND